MEIRVEDVVLRVALSKVMPGPADRSCSCNQVATRKEGSDTALSAFLYTCADTGTKTLRSFPFGDCRFAAPGKASSL